MLMQITVMFNKNIISNLTKMLVTYIAYTLYKSRAVFTIYNTLSFLTHCHLSVLSFKGAILFWCSKMTSNVTIMMTKIRHRNLSECHLTVSVMLWNNYNLRRSSTNSVRFICYPVSSCIGLHSNWYLSQKNIADFWTLPCLM